MSLWEVLWLAIIEGITEFLPVSSTGHLIMAGDVMHLPDGFKDTLIVAIQFGAIFSVVLLYWKRFFKSLDFYYKLLVGFIPAAIIGFLLDDYLEMLMGQHYVVGITLIVVGFALVFIDKWLPGGNQGSEEITYKQAFVIGLFQCVAMIPGVSRSASTIIGGLSQKLSRVAAAEFSFFLAVPTLTAAGLYSVYKHWDEISSTQIDLLIYGNVISFITAAIAVKFFIALVQKQGFRWFGFYRIAIGVAYLAFLFI